MAAARLAKGDVVEGRLRPTSGAPRQPSGDLGAAVAGLGRAGRA